MLLYRIVLLDYQLFQVVEMVAGEVFEFKVPAMTHLIAMTVPFSEVLLFGQLFKDSKVFPVKLVHFLYDPSPSGGWREHQRGIIEALLNRGQQGETICVAPAILVVIADLEYVVNIARLVSQGWEQVIVTPELSIHYEFDQIGSLLDVVDILNIDAT
jgi:hypothetical protein